MNVTPEIIDYCVKMRRSRKIKTPDAIIAATAIAHKLTLVTNNEKDFIGIKGLKLINPFKL